MKPLLFLSRTFPPVAGVGALRPAGFARLLPEFGWTPVVITVAEASLPPSRRDPSLMRFVPDGLTIRRVRDRHAELAQAARRLYTRARCVGRPPPSAAPAAAPSTTTSTRNRKGTRIGAFARCFTLPDIAAGWAIAALPACIRELPRCHAIYSCGLPLGPHLLAGILARFSRKPWICDFRDPYIWPGMRHFPTAAHEAIGRLLERGILRAATTVVTVGDGYARQLAITCPAIEEKTVVIMNGYDGELIPTSTAPGAALHILHAGTLHSDEALNCLVQGITRASQGGTPLVADFVGALDPAQEKVIAASAQAGVFRLTGRLPQGDAFARMRLADVLIVESCGVIAPVAIRAKIFEYLQLQKPILAITEPDSALARLIHENRLGVTLSPKVPADVTAVLTAWQARKQAGRPLLDPPLPDYHQFSRRVATSRLAQLLNEAISAPAGTP